MNFCSRCATEQPFTILCEGCQLWYCLTCWHGERGKNPHFCGVLTDHVGKLVRLGNIIQYPDSVRIYTVAQILPSFTKQGLCYGERSNSRNTFKEIIRPRLMIIRS